MTAIRKLTLSFALVSIGRFLWVSALQVSYPVDLLFESPTWNTAVLLHEGINIYSAQTYDAPPFNINIYTPLYFATVSLIPGFSNAPLETGRLVSLFFACSTLALLILTISSKERIQMGVIGIGWLLIFQPFFVNGAFFRMDFMALFFSACAVAVLRKDRLTWKGPAIAALFAFLSVMSKQSYIAAPLACFIYLLWSAAKHAFRFAAFFCLLLGASFYYLDQCSGGGFLWSVLVAPRNPLSLGWFTANIRQMLTPSLVTLLVLSVTACYGIFIAAIKREICLSEPGLLAALYFLTSWVWLLTSVGKVGASTNYFIEPLFASVWLLLTWASSQSEAGSGSPMYRYSWVILPMALAGDAVLTRNEPAYLLAPTLHHPVRFQQIKSEMESLKIPPSPKILNLAEPHHSLSVGWDLYLNDPAHYAVLWNTRTLSNRSMLAAIEQGYFDLIVLAKGWRPDNDPVDLTPYQKVYREIYDRYELKAELTFAYYVRRARSDPS